MDAHFPIRPATFADAAAMAAIERRSFSDPWPLEGFREVFGMPGTVALVMTDRDEPIAYFLAREILGTAEVLNLAVVPEYRGRGLGGGLLDAGLAAVRARGGSEVFLEVRASNTVGAGALRRPRVPHGGPPPWLLPPPRRGRPGAPPAPRAGGVRMMVTAGH